MSVNLEALTFPDFLQGLIGVLASGDAAAMVELNCETDFVARNEQFHEIVEQLTTALAKQASTGCSGGEISRVDGEQLGAMPAAEQGQTLKDVVALGMKRWALPIAIFAFLRFSVYAQPHIHLSPPPTLTPHRYWEFG